jgi:hypothetical protein
MHARRPRRSGGAVKILTVAEFDPAGYHLRHARQLARMGIEYRLAVHSVYRPEGNQADWVRSKARCDEEALRAYAMDADVVQFCPAIDQPRSFSSTAPYLDDAHRVPWGGIDWARLPMRGKRVAVFHGSVNLAENAEFYARVYRAEGFEVAATTIDYAHRMGATYLPAIVDLHGHEKAGRRLDAEPLRVVHSPTDLRVSSSHAFTDMAASCGVNVVIVHGATHEQALAAKSRAHCGFDHLRGCFSLNSLENAAIGLVNLVGIKDEYRHVLGDIPLPWPTVRTMDDVRDNLLDLRDDPELCREWQSRARRWSETTWHPDTVGARLLETYQRIAN